MSTDTNRNGIQTVEPVSSSCAEIGTAHPDPTRAWLFLAGVVMMLFLLASFELGR